MKSTFYRKTTKLKALLMMFVMLVSLTTPALTAKAAPNEVAQAALGIDVSKYQGVIDWNQVAASGVQFAMIRVGYRTQTTGVLNVDPYALYNLQEANRVGIKVGAYFYSTAVSEAEVLEEAAFTLAIISKYQITFPVAYDCEAYNSTSSRQYGLGRDVRTALAVRFLDTVAAAGYTPMFYGSRNAMTDSADWNMALLNKYKVWVAQYPTDPFPITTMSTYAGVHAMWQYTSHAYIAGIPSRVDMNVAYFNYDGIASAKDNSGATAVTAASSTATASAMSAANVQYTAVNEVVTPNATSVNLRTVADSSNPSTIVGVLNPGDMMFRTGIGNNGWSQVVVNGQTLYVNTSYITKVL
jgi:GH25 family lysozyme M1 (1,4-beta-N-acetylmuramidase)